MPIRCTTLRDSLDRRTLSGPFMTISTDCRSYRLQLLVSVLFLAFSVSYLAAQTPSLDRYAAGTRYIVAFPDTTTNAFDLRYPSTTPDKFFIYLYSSVDDNTVTIAQGNDPAITRMLKAGIFETVELTHTPAVTALATPSDNTFRIAAEHPIVVYCYMVTQFGAEAWTPIAVSAWGTEYYTAARPGEIVRDFHPGGAAEPRTTRVAAPSEILVIASEDSTEVKIFPNGTLADYTNTLSVRLNAGQAYLVQSLVDTNATSQVDLGGSYVTADKPIGVIGGNTRTPVIDTLAAITGNSLKNMGIEWLAPAEQHGLDFIYLPTMDGLQQDSTAADRRLAEYVRVYGTSADFKEGYYTIDDAGNSTKFGVVNRKFYENINTEAKPRYFRGETPVMGMLSSPAVTKFNGNVSYPGGKTGSSYDTWGGYMVELTPVDQYVTFAPLIAPTQPTGMDHYVNVVVNEFDRNKIVFKAGNGAEQPFDFNGGKIGGPGMVWGTMKLTPGTSYYIRSTDSTARFGGFVYGHAKGSEAWRPTGAISEYEEHLGLAYGYPLAPRRRVLGPGDSLDISLDTNACCELEVNVETVNPNPVGLESISLEAGSTNAKIVFETPDDASSVTRKTNAKFRIEPIVPGQPARSTVLVVDRTGRTSRITFDCSPDSLSISPSKVLDFGQLSPDTTCTEEEVLAINPLDRSVLVTGANLAIDTARFRIVDTDPALPASIPPGGLLKVRICFNSTDDNVAYTDTLRLGFECGRLLLPIRAFTATPCISVGDLDFNRVRESAKPAMSLTICNHGTGTLEFIDSGNGAFTWPLANFAVTQADIDRLKNAKLGPDECITISVTFKPDGLGLTQTTAKFQTNSSGCRDSSVWSALVISDTASAVPASPSTEGYALRDNVPNPFGRTTEITYTLGRAGHTVVTVYDGTGKKVTVLVDAEMEAGEHRIVWDASGVPSGTYYCRLVSGGWNGTLTMLVRH